MLDLQRAVLLHCKVDVGDPLGPPSTAPRLGFTVEWSASKFRPASPASPASQELDLYLLVKQPDTLSFFLSHATAYKEDYDYVHILVLPKNRIVQTKVLRALRERIPSRFILPRPWAHCVSGRQHVAFEHDRVFVGREDSSL